MAFMVSARATERGIAGRVQMRIAPQIDWAAIARGKALREAERTRREIEALTHAKAMKKIARARSIESFLADIANRPGLSYKTLEYKVYAVASDKRCPKPIAGKTGLSIMKEIAKKRGVSLELILSKRQLPDIADARHEAMYEVARRCQRLSYPQIGRLFEKDHSTVYLAVKRWPEKAAALGLPCYPLNREPRQ